VKEQKMDLPGGVDTAANRKNRNKENNKENKENAKKG
jgi:hypothetical protein